MSKAKKFESGDVLVCVVPDSLGGVVLGIGDICLVVGMCYLFPEEGVHVICNEGAVGTYMLPYSYCLPVECFEKIGTL